MKYQIQKDIEMRPIWKPMHLQPVLQEAADEMMDYKGSGMSVMEISHRSALFQSIIEETEHEFR